MVQSFTVQSQTQIVSENYLKKSTIEYMYLYVRNQLHPTAGPINWHILFNRIIMSSSHQSIMQVSKEMTSSSNFSRTLRWINNWSDSANRVQEKPKHCFGRKTKLKKTDYKRNEQGQKPIIHGNNTLGNDWDESELSNRKSLAAISLINQTRTIATAIRW